MTLVRTLTSRPTQHENSNIYERIICFRTGKF